MNRTIVTAAAAFVLGAITSGVLVAQAQTGAPPPPPGMAGPDRGGPHDGPGGWRRWMGGGPGERAREGMAARMEMMRAFALVQRAEDRKLTPPDVTKIAEGFLLWNGNHTWQVLHAAPEGDVIGFDLATKEGSVIAHFTMDPKTGKLNRVS